MSKEPFTFEYRGTEYGVKPLAGYELWGLVVSRNDIKKWYNMYHDENSVNIKDLCVVWGENISSGICQKMKFNWRQCLYNLYVLCATCSLHMFFTIEYGS